MTSNFEMEKRIASALSPFASLFESFAAAGYQLYAVGGCVRDWALGREPKDIDFTTDAVPEQTKHVLSANGYKVIPVGELFGTIATLIRRKSYEITTFRVKESYTRGSRHPIVCYGHELARDLERRDLTINAMAADLSGHVIDPFDGLGDLDRHVLRVPHSSYEKTLEIFGDDPLRILRLARFKARLGFGVSEEASRAAADVAGTVLSVSHERWFSELDGLFCAEHPREGIDWLREIGLWPMILPECTLLENHHIRMMSLSGDTAPGGDSLWNQTLRLLECAPKTDDLRWAALCAFIGLAANSNGHWADAVSRMIAGDIAQRFKFANARSERLQCVMRLLPAGMSAYRSARELAISLGDLMETYLTFQEIRLGAVDEETRASEAVRLEGWRQAVAPYMADPGSAQVRLPADLAARLTKEIGVRGKTLGLCIDHCREAVLDEALSEMDSCDKFVSWVRDHFED